VSLLQGRRVLVTGAGGFIGGRLVERLVLECGAEVRALVRSVSGAVRVARFPATVLRGDVTDPASLAEAMTAGGGCDTVFHCAYGTSGSQKHRSWVNREGTRRVLDAAAAAKVRRVVYLSTLMVYGKTADGDLDEAAPRRRFGNEYSDSKLDAEETALGYARAGKVPVTVLQPTAVYGPYGGVWTETVLRTMESGRVILIDGGQGLCNHVYVDDLVSAMLLAAVRDEAVGEAFLVSAEEPVTWTEMYGRFEQMLGAGPRTVSMTAEEARAHWKHSQREQPRALGELLRSVKGDRAFRDRLMRTRELLTLRELASNTLPEAWQQRIKGRLGMGSAPAPVARSGGELPIHPLSPLMIGFFSTRTRVRIDKAKRLLGFRPAFDLASGMDLTERWARWANLVP
jgi:nucleoside-diphosphate-sugar epimerase